MKLEIGSGMNPKPGYFHCDINPAYPCVEYLCSAEKLDIKSETVEEILAFNILEHIEWSRIKDTLKEWVRVLKVGGIMIIHVPDISAIGMLLDYNSEEWKEAIGQQPFNASSDRWEYLNHFVMSTDVSFNMHRAVFDYRSLTGILESFGMGDFQRLPTQSRWLYIRATKKGGLI